MVTAMSNGRNADPAVVAEKKRRIHDPHVAPLNALANRIADAEGLPHGYVPYVDPDQGGIDARVLVLLDNPSTKAEAGTGSGLLSLTTTTALHVTAAKRTHVPASRPQTSCIGMSSPSPFPASRTVVRRPPNAPAGPNGLPNSWGCAQTWRSCCCWASRPEMDGTVQESNGTWTSSRERFHTALTGA